jgi:hypothetical protein
MRRTFSLGLSCIGVSLLLTAGCQTRQPQDEYRPTATIKDLMDSLVDPSADFLFDSVATIITATGTEERAPRTDEEWTNVRRAAIRLIEATNLLVMPGRHVAKPGEKSENPEVELGPEEIEALINKDRTAWTNLAHGLNDAAMLALKAIEARDVQGLSAAGEKIDAACESCHLRYWYPNQEEQFKKVLERQPQDIRR